MYVLAHTNCEHLLVFLFDLLTSELTRYKAEIYSNNQYLFSYAYCSFKVSNINEKKNKGCFFMISSLLISKICYIVYDAID